MRRDLVGWTFWYSDRGLLLGQFGIGAQLEIGERGICYYTIVHTATDSWGKTQEQRTVFYGTELEGEAILIGMPGMIELDLTVHLKSRNWRYSIREHDLQVVSPK